jgi:hypothetical protein
MDYHVCNSRQIQQTIDNVFMYSPASHSVHVTYLPYHLTPPPLESPALELDLLIARQHDNISPTANDNHQHLVALSLPLPSHPSILQRSQQPTNTPPTRHSQVTHSNSASTPSYPAWAIDTFYLAATRGPNGEISESNPPCHLAPAGKSDLGSPTAAIHVPNHVGTCAHVR